MGEFSMEEEEWQQIKYIAQLAKPFALYGLTVGGSTTPTIQKVFNTYNSIFDHLDEKKRRLEKKRTPWKRGLLDAVEAGRSKLQKYYGETGGDSGLLYNLGAILDPAKKLETYESGCWEPHWRDYYKEQFVESYNKAYKDNAAHEPASPVTSASEGPVNLNLLTAMPRQRRRPISHGQAGKVAAYFAEGEFYAYIENLPTQSIFCTTC